MDDTARLRNFELFASLSDAEIEKLAPVCFAQPMSEDSIVFAEGRRASYLFLVERGQLALQKAIRAPHARDSRRTTVTICKPGEIAGWSALVRPFRYTLTAVSWESGMLVRVDSKLILKAMQSHPEIGYKVMTTLSAVMSRRLRQTTDALISERETSFYTP